MDLNRISWVGNICDKIESLCTKVEETMSQDTVNYVEDHMRTVGETFKTVCLDVIQDFLSESSSDTDEPDMSSSSSSDPIMTESSHLNGVHNTDIAFDTIQEVEIEEIVNNEADKMLKNSAACSVQHSCEKNTESQCADLDLSNQDSPMTNDYNNDITKCESCFTGVWEDTDINNPVPTSNEIDDTMKNDSAAKKLNFGEASGGSDDSLRVLKDVVIESAAVVDVSYSEANEVGMSVEMRDDDSNNGMTKVPSSGSSISGYFLEISYPIAVGKIENSDSDNKQGALVIEEFDDINLEESCFLGEKNEHFSLGLRPDQHKSSYKNKKIMCGRRRSKGKRHEEQSGVWYKDESGMSLKPSEWMHERVEDAQFDTSSESDWEII